MIILDTNVLSEPMNPEPAANVSRHANKYIKIENDGDAPTIC